MLVSLLSFPLARLVASRTSGDFQPLAVGLVYLAGGALICIVGIVLAIVGLFRPRRTWLAWTSFGVALILLFGFCLQVVFSLTR